MNTVAFILILIVALILLALGILMIAFNTRFTNSKGVLIAGIVITIIGALLLLIDLVWYFSTRPKKEIIIRQTQPQITTTVTPTAVVTPVAAPISPPLINRQSTVVVREVATTPIAYEDLYSIQ